MDMSAHIRKHETMARASLESLVERSKIKVLREAMESDGWLDGMRVLTAEIETVDGKRLTIRWHDGNRGWMQKLGSGWGILFEKELRPAREQVVNILTGEVTQIPEGWAWDNYMEFLHS